MNDKRLKEYIEEAKETAFMMRDKINIDSKNTFGIEVEFENVNLDTIKYGKKWQVKEDDTTTTKINGSSIGGEVSSPILRDNEECWKDIEHVCHYLSKKGAVATFATGGHIHIGAQVLKDDPNNIRKLLKQWELFEDIIYSFSSGRDKELRSSVAVQAKKISPKLKRIRDTKYGYSKYQTFYDWYRFLKKFQLNKFDCLNFKNYKDCKEDYNNTIEIRCPNGTIDSVIWQNNINFFIKFFEHCCDENFDEEYIDYLLYKKETIETENIYDMFHAEDSLKLVDLIFKERIDKIMFLKQYLKIFDNDKQKQYTKK